jgi:hypothetical protein
MPPRPEAHAGHVVRVARAAGARALGSVVAPFALLALLTAPRRAEARVADSFPEAWYLPIGLTAGAVARSHGSGGVLGAEASFVRFPMANDYFAGAYVDALYDFGNRRTRLSLGPELGLRVFGLDGGPALQIGDGRTDVGWYARGFFTVGFFSIYARTGSFPGAPDPRAFLEGGVLLKWPIQVAASPEPPESREVPPRPPPPAPPPPPPPPEIVPLPPPAPILP